METIEIVVYLAVAFMLGGVILGFIVGVDPTLIYGKIHSIIFGDEKVRYEKLTPDEFPAKIFRFWESCAFGQENASLVVFVDLGVNKTDTTLTKQEVFASLQKYNLCYSLQSLENDCGDREDVVMSDLNLPALVSLKCDSEQQKLFIES